MTSMRRQTFDVGHLNITCSDCGKQIQELHAQRSIVLTVLLRQIKRNRKC
ncbi:hypothetical protein HY230_06155 [Candidatus Acetothermia bacterium]|nr:hypothetical protein [Candidatus Acetothermia bacterium]